MLVPLCLLAVHAACTGSRAEEQKPNVRIMTIPEAGEWARVVAAVREAAALCGGEPVPEPHCTLHYLHNVDLDGVKVLQTELPEIARRVLSCQIDHVLISAHFHIGNVRSKLVPDNTWRDA